MIDFIDMKIYFVLDNRCCGLIFLYVRIFEVILMNLVYVMNIWIWFLKRLMRILVNDFKIGLVERIE